MYKYVCMGSVSHHVELELRHEAPMGHRCNRLGLQWGRGKKAGVHHHPFACGFELIYSLCIEEGDHTFRHQNSSLDSGSLTKDTGSTCHLADKKRSICFC